MAPLFWEGSPQDFWNPAAGVCAPRATGALARSGTGVGQQGPRLTVGVPICPRGAGRGQGQGSSFSTATWENIFFFFNVMLKQERQSCPNIHNMYIRRYVVTALLVRQGHGVKSCENLAFKTTYDFKKVLIAPYRSPTGISVWENSPSFPLPRRLPSVLTVCSV